MDADTDIYAHAVSARCSVGIRRLLAKCIDPPLRRTARFGRQAKEAKPAAPVEPIVVTPEGEKKDRAGRACNATSPQRGRSAKLGVLTAWQRAT